MAEIVYDNSTNYLGFSHDSLLEYGDEIALAGTERYITNFMFEYFASFTPTGDETAQLRFYANDGPLDNNASETPGTLLFESTEFSIETGYKRGVVDGLGFLIPDRFTWTIEFNGLAEDERAGLLFYDPPAAGGSFNDFWERREEGWTLLEFTDLPANFAARVQATDAPVVQNTVSIAGVQIESGVATIQVTANPGRVYRLLYVNELGGNWQAAAGLKIRASSETVTLQDPEAGSAPSRFYRVEESTTTIQAAGAQATITAASDPGTEYVLQGTTDFQSWETLPGSTTATGYTVNFTVPTEGPLQFFRVVPATQG